jgi:hypothetical protein
MSAWFFDSQISIYNNDRERNEILIRITAGKIVKTISTIFNLG